MADPLRTGRPGTGGRARPLADASAPDTTSRRARRRALGLVALVLAGCAATPPPAPPRPVVRPRTPVLPHVVDERQNPHRLMLLADNELDQCETGVGAEKLNACRRRTLYVERAKRLGWCLVAAGADANPGPTWAPCPARR